MESKSNRMGLFLFIIFLAFAAVVYTFFVGKRVVTISEKAEERALLLGRQLIDNEFNVKVFVPDESKFKPETERGLASQGTDSDVVEITKKVVDGELGRDPWGSPFYFTLKGDGKTGSKLFIWSKGANGQADFKKPEDMLTNGMPYGDDVMVSITI
jgi:hypothetical protein